MPEIKLLSGSAGKPLIKAAGIFKYFVTRHMMKCCLQLLATIFVL